MYKSLEMCTIHIFRVQSFKVLDTHILQESPLLSLSPSLPLKLMDTLPFHINMPFVGVIEGHDGKAVRKITAPLPLPPLFDLPFPLSSSLYSLNSRLILSPHSHVTPYKHLVLQGVL